MEEKEARSPFSGNRFFPPHSGPRTFKEMLEGRPRRGRFDMHQKDEIMTAFRRISSGRGQAGDWEKAIKGYGIQATSDAFAENTWSNHGTAAGHWSRFVKARGLRTEILWVEQPTAEQRAELKMIFQEYMAWLCCAVAAREGEGMTPPSTIEAYARSIVTLHKLLDVDLSCVSSTISGFKKGRTKHLVDLRGPRMKAKKKRVQRGPAQELAHTGLVTFPRHGEPTATGHRSPSAGAGILRLPVEAVGRDDQVGELGTVLERLAGQREMVRPGLEGGRAVARQPTEAARDRPVSQFTPSSL